MNKQRVVLKVINNHCNDCKRDFQTYYMTGFRYGERLINTEDGSRTAYMNCFEDRVIGEFQEILSIFYKGNNVDVFNKIFGICCDKIDGKSVDAYRISDSCYYCLSANTYIKSEEYGKEVIIPVITHEEWGKYSYEEKKRKVYDELVKRELV